LADDVNFVLIYEGFISTGMSESWSDTSKRWTFEGSIHLVDREKTRAAGKNVDKRVIAVKYTSDAPTKLFLDGKEYDLSPSAGRVFILRDAGEPVQTSRTLPLRDEKELTAIGDFAVQHLKEAAAKTAGADREFDYLLGTFSLPVHPDAGYVPAGVKISDIPPNEIEWSDEQNGLCAGLKVAGRDWQIGGEVKVELWVRNDSDKDVKFHHNGRNDIGLRVKMHGADGKEHDANIAQFRGYPVFTKHLLKAGHVFKAKEFTLRLAKPKESPARDPWFDLAAGDYKFRCEVDIPGTTATDGAGKKLIPAEGEWSGTINSGEIAVKLAAAVVDPSR
jgi:hypothetical protein